MKRNNRQSGITMVEILIVTGIIVLLFTISTISLLNIRVSSSTSASTNVLISDIKAQQIKALAGDTEGRGVPDNYGVKIQSNKYTLFHGISYSASENTNFDVPVETGYQLSTTFPDATILFVPKSGEIENFTSGQNSVTLTNTSTGRTKTIQFNKYGTIISSN